MSTRHSKAGTLGYMAPEVLAAGGRHSRNDAPGYSIKADVWSLGMTLYGISYLGMYFLCYVYFANCRYVILSGFNFPFDESSQELAPDWSMPDFDAALGVPNTTTEFIRRCLTIDPRNRPNTTTLLK